MCKVRIEKSLAYEKVVQSAVLDVPTKVLTVTHKADKTTPAALRTAVQKTGYDADELTADARAYNHLPDCCKKTNAIHWTRACHHEEARRSNPSTPSECPVGVISPF